MNNFKQEWFIDFAPRRMTIASNQHQLISATGKTTGKDDPDSEPLTDQHGKITVKA